MDYKIMLTNKYLREINAKFYLCKKMNDGNDKSDIGKWMVAQKRHRLSDKQVQMARELGLNPDKLGKIDNHKQEAWKAPLPQFIESIYFKRFKRENPETVKPLKQIMAEMEVKKKQQKAKKEERRKQRALSSGSEE